MWKHTGAYRNDPRQNHVDMDGVRVLKDQPFTLIGADGNTYYPMTRETFASHRKRASTAIAFCSRS